MKAFALFRDPTFLVGVPVLAMGLLYNQPTLMGLGFSLISCALI